MAAWPAQHPANEEAKRRLAGIEDQIDRAAELWDLTDPELEETRKGFGIAPVKAGWTVRRPTMSDSRPFCQAHLPLPLPPFPLFPSPTRARKLSLSATASQLRDGRFGQNIGMQFVRTTAFTSQSH
jgi:hypothetical protein